MYTRVLKDNLGNYYGIVGEVTEMTYKNGEPMQVGDLVELIDNRSGRNLGLRFVEKEPTSCTYGIMGVHTRTFKKGKENDNIWTVELYKKLYDNPLNTKDKSELVITELTPRLPKRIITIDGKDIEISEDSFQELKRQLCS